MCVILFHSSNSLFAIPANQEFVHVQLEQSGYRDKAAALTKTLIDICTSAFSKHALTTSPLQPGK